MLTVSGGVSYSVYSVNGSTHINTEPIEQLTPARVSDCTAYPPCATGTLPLRRGLSLEGYMELIILLAIVAIGLVTVLA